MQEQAKVAACAAVTFALEAFLEAEVSVKLGREKGEARRRSGQERLMAWQCGHGGCREANQWTRDGHDQRDRSTGWGHLSGLPVPMLACQRCQPDVVSHFALMETYHRDGMDLDHQVLFGSGFGESLRPFQERWRDVWDCGRSMNGSIRWSRWPRVLTPSPSRRFPPSSHGMASG